MRGLRPVNAAWKVPTILTDASPQIELVRHLWLDMKLAGDIAVDRRATFPRAEDARLISWTPELSANYGFFLGRRLIAWRAAPDCPRSARQGSANYSS